MCPDGCVIFKLTAKPLGNENFHTGGFWDYPDPVIAIFYHKNSQPSLTTSLTHREEKKQEIIGNLNGKIILR